MDLDKLLMANPWWASPPAINNDPHIRSYRAGTFQWVPPVLDELPLIPGSLHTLRGPRQVGKTTTVKLLMERLISRGERRVLYYSLDMESDKSVIPDILQLAKKTHPDGNSGPWYIFLDEVTSINDWQRGIKYAWDQGIIRDDFVLCTGSSAPAMVTERLPGRRGNGHDWIQLPISFREYCRTIRKIDLPDAVTTAGGYLTPTGLKLAKAIDLHSRELSIAFEQYKQSGGFPRAVTDITTSGIVSPSTIEILWTTLAGDVESLGRDKVAVLKMLERLGVSLGSPIAWDTLREAMDVGSHNTAREYAQILAESFQILITYFLSANGSVEPKKQRKIYYMDPLIAQIPVYMLQGSRKPNPDGMIENLVGIGLFRSSATQLLPATPLPGSVAYWRSGKGREIDFVVWDSNGDGSGHAPARVPIEVKGDSSAEIKGAASSIRQSFGKGIIVSRNVFEPDGDIPVLPVYLFLAGLQERAERVEI